jgi:hypothetical protein
MSQREVNAIVGRPSLRATQAESLARLARAIEASTAMLKHGSDEQDWQAMGPSLKSDERFEMSAQAEDKRLVDFGAFLRKAG